MDTGPLIPKFSRWSFTPRDETGEGFSGEIRAFNGTVSGTLTNNYSYAESRERSNSSLQSAAADRKYGTR